MDRRIERKGLGRRGKIAVLAIIALVVAGCVYALTGGGSFGQSQKLARASLTTSKVVRGNFQHVLSVRGTLNSRTTIYLDAIAGGIVEQKLLEKGAFVKKGQPLLQLSNTSLKLEVISREAQIAEQLNFLRNNQLLAETTRLQLRSDILTNQNQIAHLEQQIERVKPLVERGLLPRTQLTELNLDLGYYRNRNRIAVERQTQEEAIRSKQLAQLENSANALQRMLDESRKVLDDLTVRAPVDGYLSELNAELGESKTPGTRLGRIDVPGSFKVLAALDEYYLNQVSPGMAAHIVTDGQKHATQVAKIDPRVNNGKFMVEIDVPAGLSSVDSGMKLGQSLDVELTLGAGRANALLVERGAFVNDTGGNWVFVLTRDQERAERRAIRLGRRNKDYYEVLSGLEPGEIVVTSSYGAFDKAETLDLN